MRDALIADRVDTEYLLTIDDAEIGSGSAYVLTERAGARTIYPHAGVNNYLAREVSERGLLPRLEESVANHRILHLSSFVGADERMLQQRLVTSLDDDTILSFTPGSIYAKLGGDRLASILKRVNLLFMYEQQLDLLLRRTNLGPVSLGTRMEDKMRTLFAWRARLGSDEPLVLVVKRPAELVSGLRGDYVVMGFGWASMEGFTQPDAQESHYEVVDATGAGDALAAGMLFALLREAAPIDAANFAYVMALSASGELGGRAGLPNPSSASQQWRKYLPSSSLPLWLVLPGHAEPPAA
jgi:sugar/nucleoside kinase (ribokinase family)